MDALVSRVIVMMCLKMPAVKHFQASVMLASGFGYSPR